MNFKLDNQTLTLFFEGEINSTTASKIDQEVMAVVSSNQFEKLVLDFNKVVYVSSAGLRIILKLKQLYKDTIIVGATLEVYDVLQMTGFTKIMEVHKAINTIDVDGCEVIGEGYFSIVYRINKDTIIKVFKQDVALHEVERELNLAKQAFILGVPTAISFDVVMVNGHYGVRFEMLDSVSLRDLFKASDANYEELLSKYVTLLKTINTTESDDDTLPDSKAKWLEKVESLKPYLTATDYEKAYSLISSIEERKTFVHGDCHFKNIMSQGNELFLIDMDTLSRGHPIFELAALYAPYIAFEEDDPGNSLRFLGLDGKFTTKLYLDIVNAYTKEPDALDKIKIVAYIHMLWWNQTNEPDNKIRFEGCKSRLLALLPKYNDLNIGV